jgi:tetratricopeptide (TPR) repeat protein
MDLNVAGALATARKHYPEAEELLLHALAIVENSLPPGRSETGEVLLNLAEVYRLQKKLEQSQETYKRGLAVVLSAWCPRDLRLPRWLDAYAAVLRGQQDFAEAAKIEAQATGIRVARLLHGH